MQSQSKLILKAIMRTPGKEIVNGLSEQPLPSPIEYEKVSTQHAFYVKTLQKIGFFTEVLPSDERFPDGCFVEDTYLILPEVVIRLNPGAPTRANEYERLEQSLPHDREHVLLPKEYKIDGGDILVAGKRIYIGLSNRTQLASIDKVRDILTVHDYTVIAFPVPKGLHLKSGMTCIDENVFILQPAFKEEFDALHHALGEEKTSFIVPEDEHFAANVLPLNGHILIPPGCPKTKAFIANYLPSDNIHEVDTSELRKVDGALTCLSLPHQVYKNMLSGK
jgi:dimethylargininase